MDWTIYRYKALLIENELAGQIMQDVTKTLVEMLGITHGVELFGVRKSMMSLAKPVRAAHSSPRSKR